MNNHSHPNNSTAPSTTAAAAAAVPAAIAEAIRSLDWSLDAPSLPMRFLPLSQLAAQPGAPSSNNNPTLSTGEDVLGTVALLRSQAVAAVQVPNNNSNNSSNRNNNNDDDDNDENENNNNNAEHWARIATALLLLGHGYGDHAHNLVGPLSFPQPLPYFHGPPVACPPPVLAAASVAHCLVHRREGWHESEFHQTGVGNARYWAGAAMRSGGEETLPLAALHSAVRRQVVRVVAQQQKNNRNIASAATDWWDAACRDYYHHGTGATEECWWDPRPVTELCATVLEYLEAHHERHVLHELAEQAALAEVRVLLHHALAQLGYDAAHLGLLLEDSSDAATASAGVGHSLLPSSSTTTTSATTTAPTTTPNNNNATTEAAAAPTQQQQQQVRLPDTLQEALQHDNARQHWQHCALVVTTAAAPHRIVHVNPAWVQLCGYTPEQACGQTFGVLLQGRDTNRTVAAALVQTCVATREPQEAYLVNYTACGERFLNHLTIAPLKATATSASAEYMVGILEKVNLEREGKRHPHPRASPTAVV